MYQINNVGTFKREWESFFKDLGYSFRPNFQNPSKSIGNKFYVVKKPLDQIFWVKIWAKWPNFEFRHFYIGKSWKFSKVAKINFFCLEWSQNWSVCWEKLKFWYQTFKPAKRSRFWRFLANLVIFDRFWKWPNLGVIFVLNFHFSFKSW